MSEVVKNQSQYENFNKVDNTNQSTDEKLKTKKENSKVYFFFINIKQNFYYWNI